MNQIQLIPKEIQSIIPRFDGDDKLLNLFISKCEYVIRSFRGESNPAQQVYLYHCITSRLVGKAAVLVSERENVSTWEELKELFVQHFGDPRSEACISIELENMKIKQGESYIDFCHRIQNVRSSLISKINLLTDEGLKAAKYIIVNNTSLSVFMYNLPEDLIKFVRLNKCTTLESALSVVTEEVNFQTRYNAKNKNKNVNHNQPTTSKPNFITPTQQKFGYSQNNAQLKPQQPFKPNFVPTPNNQKLGNQQPHQGFKPNFNHNRPFVNQPQQFPRTLNNYKQSGFFKSNPNQQFRFGINNQTPKPHNTDVSMRTVRNNMLNDDEQNDYVDCEYEYEQNYDETCNEEQYENTDDTVNNEEENFHILASPISQQR